MTTASGILDLPSLLAVLPTHLESAPPPLPAHARPAAVLLPLVPAGDDLAVLLTVRRSDLPDHPGQVCLPGGRIEPGETPLAAALRETAEEIGLPPSRIRPLGFLPCCETGTGYAIAPLVGHVQTLPPLRPAPEEVATIFTLPLRHLLAPGAFSREAVPGGRRPWYWVIRWKGHLVWGATAAILFTFRCRLLTAATSKAEADAATGSAAHRRA